VAEATLAPLSVEALASAGGGVGVTGLGVVVVGAADVGAALSALVVLPLHADSSAMRAAAVTAIRRGRLVMG
jgi:hypothetical protein